MTNWTYYVSCLLAVLFGYLLRVCQDVRNGRYTVKTAIIQFIVSVSFSYLAYLLHRDKVIKYMSLEVLLFVVSYFGSIIITFADGFAKFGLKTYALIILKRFVSDMSKDQQNEN